MKRLVVPALLALLVAACAGGHRAPQQGVYIPPPPPPSHPGKPSPQQSASRVAVPQHVDSAGPLKTAMVSTYMDGQERDLRQRLRAYGINIARRGDGVVLNANNAVLFDGNQLSPAGSNMLVSLAVVLRRYDHSAVNVAGYTDTTGAPEQNMTVSLKRARLVADALVKNGVAAPRVSAQGYGETNLKIRTGDSVDEKRNRRIEIRVMPTPVG